MHGCCGSILVYREVKSWYLDDVSYRFSSQDDVLSRRERIEILLEEYRALNSLLLFRLTAMDRRLPVSVGFFAVAVTSMLALPSDSRTAVLVVTPPALLWLVRTTVQHARAKEDHLRRIDEIEQTINSIAGEELLIFQSRHPNGATVAAGRSGRATVVATSFGAIAMLVMCLCVFLREPNSVPWWLYAIYVAAIGADIVSCTIGLSRYRYQKTARVVVRD